MRTTEEWINVFSEMVALWIHDGNPERPHALLTSGKHSNGFFNASKVIVNPSILKEACLDIVKGNRGDVPEHSRGDMVIGSALGAITIAHVMAELLNATCGFTEPVVANGEKTMQLKRFSIESAERILPVEDVISTGDTTLKTIAELKQKGAIIHPVVIVLVNRSGKEYLDQYKIISLIDHPMPMWKAEDCPLCQQGSEEIRPKCNWDKLTGDY